MKIKQSETTWTTCTEEWIYWKARITRLRKVSKTSDASKVDLRGLATHTHTHRHRHAQLRTSNGGEADTLMHRSPSALLDAICWNVRCVCVRWWLDTTTSVSSEREKAIRARRKKKWDTTNIRHRVRNVCWWDSLPTWTNTVGRHKKHIPECDVFLRACMCVCVWVFSEWKNRKRKKKVVVKVSAKVMLTSGDDNCYRHRCNYLSTFFTAQLLTHKCCCYWYCCCKRAQVWTVVGRGDSLILG